MWYICVRTYGNGHWQNKIFPQIFAEYDKCLKKCEELQKKDDPENDSRWIPFPMYCED